MKERRERTMREILDENDVDWAIRNRFKAERQPAKTVDGDEVDLYDTPDDELPGMWERADFMGGEC